MCRRNDCILSSSSGTQNNPERHFYIFINGTSRNTRRRRRNCTGPFASQNRSSLLSEQEVVGSSCNFRAGKWFSAGSSATCMFSTSYSNGLVCFIFERSLVQMVLSSADAPWGAAWVASSFVESPWFIALPGLHGASYSLGLFLYRHLDEIYLSHRLILVGRSLFTF
jgi:hypothetical protein